eukprot:scaffold35145_cov20-Tisochrysis_lutea.AAC.1
MLSGTKKCLVAKEKLIRLGAQHGQPHRTASDGTDSLSVLLLAIELFNICFHNSVLCTVSGEEKSWNFGGTMRSKTSTPRP